MSRSSKKGPYIDEKLLEKVKNSNPESKEMINTWSRRATITPEMIGYTFGVYNGKEHIKVQVSEEMVGHLLGEFSPTKKFIRHGGKMQRQQEKKK
jgi:small subunit ribosomal protein S19